MIIFVLNCWISTSQTVIYGIINIIFKLNTFWVWYFKYCTFSWKARYQIKFNWCMDVFHWTFYLQTCGNSAPNLLNECFNLFNHLVCGHYVHSVKSFKAVCRENDSSLKFHLSKFQCVKNCLNTSTNNSVCYGIHWHGL